MREKKRGRERVVEYVLTTKKYSETVIGSHYIILTIILLLNASIATEI